MAITATDAVLDVTETPAPTSKRRSSLRFLRGSKTVTGLAILGFFVLLAIIGPWIAPYDPDAMSDDLLQPPSWDHWFGTTQTGQDVFSQILVGTRGVLVVGFVAGILATVLSVIIGVSAGFMGGIVDELLSGLSNVFLVIPALPLIIIIASFVPDSGDLLIALVVALTAWAWGARVLRAQTLSLRRRDYVEAARATGEPTWRLICFEIMPNLTAVIASGFVGTVIFAILLEITLAFVGVADISNWNWGTVLFWAQSSQALGQGAWWWFVPPGLFIALLGTSLSLINFGIDEFINPRLRTESGADRKVRMRVGFTPVNRRPHPPEEGGPEGSVPRQGAPVDPLDAELGGFTPVLRKTATPDATETASANGASPAADPPAPVEKPATAGKPAAEQSEPDPSQGEAPRAEKKEAGA